MDLSRPLAVVTPTVDADVLQTLARAEAAFTPGELHRLIGAHSVAGVRKSLTRLVAQGIVTQQRAGPAYLYSLNRRHLAAPYIGGLAGLRSELLSRLAGLFEQWQSAPAYAAMFGSAARGQMRPDSDIDVFVVRADDVDAEATGWVADIEELQRKASEWTGNDVRILEMGQAEVVAGLESGEAVLEEIRRDGLTLFGDPVVLRPRRTRAQRSRRAQAGHARG